MIFEKKFYCVRIACKYNPRIVLLGSTYVSSFHLKCKTICSIGFILMKTHNKKMMKEYRLVRNFNFIILYKVSQSALLSCSQTDTFVNNRNKFSNLSALVAQMLWVRARILLGSRYTITSKITMTLLKMLFIKLKSRQLRFIAP